MQLPTKSSSRRLVRAMLLAAGVISAAVLGTIVGLTFMSSAQLNADAASRQQARLSAALDQQALNAKADLTLTLTGRSTRTVDPATVVAPESAGQIGYRSFNYFGFTALYILDGTFAPLVGFEFGKAVDISAWQGHRAYLGPIVHAVAMKVAHTDSVTAALTSPAFETATGASELVYNGQNPARVTVVPLRSLNGLPVSGQIGPFMAVGIQNLSEAEIRNMELHQGLGSLQVTHRPLGDAAVNWPLPDGANREAAFLAWYPDRPGDQMLANFAFAMLIALGFVGAVFALVLVRLKNATQIMEQREHLIERLAGFDALSSLPNRRTFDHRLDQELSMIERSGGSLAVMMLDLDKFKAVNDTYGHKAGDELIRQVSKRLSDLLRASDTLSRFGGDEFAIIQTEVTTASDVAALAGRILDCIRRPFQIGEHEVTVGVSIGIALAPANGTQRDVLMRLADTALYQAKNEGRNRYSFFDRTMDRSLQIRRLVAEDLRSAIEKNELSLAFQPQVSSDGMTIHGVEALVRWTHPTQGFIPPSDFIPIAEERGLIMPLSSWVLRNACLAAKAWPHLKLAVNVSPVEFRNKNFVANVAAILEATGFDPARLELELTEGVLVDDADAAEAAMMELRGLGISLALDDFGTGYSSLIYLRRFAFDKIKIDRSFLEYMETTGESAILIHSVVHLGRALGLKVCAEGVETTEQHRFLQAVGCHELQGYLFSRPVPAAQIDAMIAQGGLLLTA